MPKVVRQKNKGIDTNLSTCPRFLRLLVESLIQREKDATHCLPHCSMPIETCQAEPYSRYSWRETAQTDSHADYFQVDYIKRSRYDEGHQTVLYEVKWIGYPDSENTWEPRENLLPWVYSTTQEFLFLTNNL